MMSDRRFLWLRIPCESRRRTVYNGACLRLINRRALHVRILIIARYIRPAVKYERMFA